MNTIKITLRTSGSIADLYKDFNLYVGGYNNKMIEVYVPKSLIYTNEENTFISAVKIGAILTSTTGALVNTNSYYLDYVDEETVNGIVYAVYESQLPKEFTVYQGTQQIVANLVNINNTDPENPVILSVVTTQTANVDVLLSSYLADETLDPTQVEVIMAELALKQDADTTGNTTEINIAPISTTKEVVPAINALGTQVNTNVGNITANTEDIAQNAEDIAYLQAHMTTGENFVGEFPTQTTLPTNEQLQTFVYGIEGRNPLNGDVVIFTLTVEGGTDLVYKYFYTAEGWRYYAIPSLEASSNGTLGSLKGTYGVGSTNTTLVDIAGGQILNIWIKDGTDTYRNIREYLNTNATSIANIIAGNTSVGQAVKALQDGLGNNIVNTYLTQNSGATKQYVRDYSLPREFNDTYFISSTGYQTDIPTTPVSGIQFSEVSSAIGDLTLFQLEKINEADFELSSKNSSSNAIYVSADQNCTVYFRMTTQAQNDGVNWIDLSVELTNSATLTAGEIYKIQLGTTFSYLGNTILTMTVDDLTRQTFEVVTQSSTTTTFSVYSNATYPSSYNLAVQSLVNIVAQGDLGEQPVYELTGTLVEEKINFEIPTMIVLNENTEAKFVLNYTTVTAPADDVEVTLTYGEQAVRLITPYNQNSGNALVSYLKQTNNQFTSGVQNWTFKGFVQYIGSDISILVDIDDLTNIQEQITTITEQLTGLPINEVVDATTKILIHATASVAFNLYLEAGTTKDTNINWGDLTNEDITSWGTKQHTYAITGYYWIIITSNTGTLVNMPQLYVNKQTDKSLYYKVILSNLLTSIIDNSFDECNSLNSIILSNNITSIGNYAFHLCAGLTSITLTRNILSIGNNAFQDCYYLTSITLSSLTSIGDYCFSGCYGLISIKIPRTLTSIGSSIFLGCASLVSIIIPDNITSIGDYAFYVCRYLTSIIIPLNVTSIGNQTFNGCSALRTMTILATTPPILSDINAISSATTAIYVPASSLTAYKTATNWSTYADIIYPIADGEYIEGMTTDIENLDIYKVGGNTIYGGTLSSDLNAETKSGFYTCYTGTTGLSAEMTALGVSFFVEHINSSVGVNGATQKAIAFVSTSIIIFERVKIGGVWGTWFRHILTATATLPSASWTGSSAPYTKAVTVSGIYANDTPSIDLDLSAVAYANVEAMQTDWAKIYRAVPTADTITFYASEVPTADISLQIKVVR